MMSVLRLHGCALIHHCSECTRTEMLPFLHCCLLIFKLREPRRALQLSSSARFLVGPCLDQRGCLSAHGGEDAFCFSAYLNEVSNVEQVVKSVAGEKVQVQLPLLWG